MPKLATDLKAPNRTEDAEQFARRRPCRDDVRASVSRAVFPLTTAGAVWSSLWCAAAGDAHTNDLQPGEVFGACRRGRRRWGARSEVRRRGDVFLGACRRWRRRGGLQLYQLRAAWGATGQLSGIWLGPWVAIFVMHVGFWQVRRKGS